MKILRDIDLEKKVCVLLGTRPCIIKMSPIVHELERRGQEYFVLHSGQHYSHMMTQIFIDELRISNLKYVVNGVSKYKTHGGQTSKMIMEIERILLHEKPQLLLVVGDANTTLAGALAARKLHILVGHLEAGLRSWDWRMPEEHNRIIVDHISDHLYAPTKLAENNLREEKVHGKIFLTGNSVVDAIEEHVEIAKSQNTLKHLGLEKERYFVLTLHREENLDYDQRFRQIAKWLRYYSKDSDHEIVFPVHPRTKKKLNELKLLKSMRGMSGLRILPPLGYFDFINLLRNSRLVLTDSGGIQEESCILKVPCVTIRDNTERPETVEVGANYIAGIDPLSITKGVESMVKRTRDWVNPFGVHPSRNIIDIVERSLW